MQHVPFLQNVAQLTSGGPERHKRRQDSFDEVSRKLSPSELVLEQLKENPFELIPKYQEGHGRLPGVQHTTTPTTAAIGIAWLVLICG